MLKTDTEVATALKARGIDRVFHVTPARNLPGILRDQAIRSVRDMAVDARAVYAPNDLQRLDGHPDKISFSLQYPNAFYLRQVKKRPAAQNFPDWVCFILSPDVVAVTGALFCPRNAGSIGGDKRAGVPGLDSCYERSVSGSHGVTFQRGPLHDPRCPTDVQAEVLVPAPIPLSLVRAIVFPSEQAASNERARLEQLSVPVPNRIEWIISAAVFDTGCVTDAVRRSRPIFESSWTSEMDQP